MRRVECPSYAERRDASCGLVLKLEFIHLRFLERRCPTADRICKSGAA